MAAVRAGVAVLSGLAAMAAAGAWAEVAPTRFERLSQAADVIRNTVCQVDEVAMYQGGVDAINALPGRRDLSRIALQKPGFEGFREALLSADTGGDAEAIEDAAIEGMVRVADRQGSYIVVRDPPAAAGAQIHGEATPSVEWRVDEGVGIVTIHSFTKGTAKRIEEAVRSMQGAAKRPAGYVLDLRGNGGGLLAEVVAAADVFIDGKEGAKVVPYGGCHPEDKVNFPMQRGDASERAPLRVIVDRSTASGAEWLAAVLRERRQAVLVGQPTFGNGRVFTVMPLGRDAYLKLTTGLLTTASGTSWDGKGLTPDVAAARNSHSDPAMEAARGSLTAR